LADSFNIGIIPYDYTALTAYYTSGASLGTARHAEVLKNGPLGALLTRNKVGINPPWLTQPVLSEETNAVKERIFAGGVLIDTKDPSVVKEGVDENFTNLFALWKGLQRMKEVAEFAQTSTGQAMSTLLDSTFQNYQTDVKTFLEDTRFNDMTMVQGIKKDKVISTLERPAFTPTDTIYGLPIRDVFESPKLTTVRADVISGLAGTETFTINVTKSGTTTAVNVDLSTAASMNLDDITTAITSAMSGAGFSTTFDVKRFHETSYGIEIDPNSSGETLEFTSASDTSGAVYAVGRAGSASNAMGFTMKLDDLSAADPNQVFYEVTNTTEKYDATNGVVVDSQGYVYSVGTTAGSLDNQINPGGNDVFLIKRDHAGNDVWTQLLGSAANSAGFAVAVDGDDNVVVTGQTAGELDEEAYGGLMDTFVTQYDSEGAEQWTRQASPSANDNGLALTIDSSNNIYISGLSRGIIGSGETYSGGSDAFVTKLDSSGTLVYDEQFGDSGDEMATAITVDSSGNVYVAGSDDGNGFLRKYDSSSTPNLTYNLDLGSLGSDGGISGVALTSAGDLYVSGYTTNTALDSTVVNAHSGGTDGFVLSIDDQTSTAAVSYVTYIGNAGVDRAHGLAVNTTDDSFYLAGETDGTFAGESSSSDVDAYITKFNSSGAVQYTHQFGGGFDHKAFDIAYDSDGTSVLSRLGLPAGDVPVKAATTIVSQTGVRPDQSFILDIRDVDRAKITVDRTDSFRWLAFEINKELGIYGKAYVETEGDIERLIIQAFNGADISLKKGPDGFDALAGLGFTESRIFGDSEDTIDTADATPSASVFALGLTSATNVLTDDGARDAVVLLDNALREVESAYRFLTVGPEDDLPKPVGSASAYTLNRIANLQFALDRMTASQPTSLFSI